MRSSLLIGIIVLMISCQLSLDSGESTNLQDEDPSQFEMVGELSLQGGTSAAEISSYDSENGYLFVTNNAAGYRIDVIDINNPNQPIYKDSIYLNRPGGAELVINSLDISKDILAVAVAAANKTDPGTVYLFNKNNFQLIKSIEVGSLPDMITFTPNGQYILTANEGEPNDDYSIDPNGSISIISTTNKYDKTTIDFASFEGKKDQLIANGFRIFGPNASFSQDIEPEYIAISSDSKYAWVTLQENNGIARIDLFSQKVIDMFGLGFKDFSLEGNQIDICDLDSIVNLSNWPIKGIYQPDAIAVFNYEDNYYLITANEGDGRDYPGFSEIARVADLTLDTTRFDHAELLKNCEQLGRMVVTTTMGDIDQDGDYDELYAFGSRSFSIWNGLTGELIMDSKNLLERNLIENTELYDDNRSDDRGVEPEGITVGIINGKTIAFVGLERANSVLTFDISNPKDPKFLQILKTGIGPEGVLFIPQEKSKNGKSMFIVGTEMDGKIQIFQPKSTSIE